MRVFITGLTGTLGTALARLHHGRGDRVWGCARNESRAVEWIREHREAATLFCCDAEAVNYQDTDAGKILPTMDRLYHLAAMKHVDLCEQNPAEAFRQNIVLTQEIAAVCSHEGIPFVLASTDKACMPTGVYGATKLLAEKIVLREGGAVVRLGNLIGSSGSVFQLWKEALGRGERIRLTDPDMTRFFIPVREAAAFMADEAEPGRVSAPDMRSVRMGEVAHRTVHPHDHRVEVIGPRPGEAKHQMLFEGGDCSESAPKWDVDELLREAGVRT